MKNNISCDYCDKVYDYYEERCPHCGEPNKIDGVKESQHITMVRWWKQLAFFVIGWLGFQLTAIIFSAILKAISKPITDEEIMLYNAAVNFGSYGVIFIALCLTTFTDYKKVFKSFMIGKWKPYVFGIVGLLAIFSFNLVYNGFLTSIHYDPGVNNNETGVRSIVVVYPVMSIVIFGIIGPICEEFTYRLGLFSLFRRIHISLAFIISTIVFALIHFDWFSIGTSSFTKELINLPPYIFSGLTFAFLYYKLGLAASLSCHITNNLVSILTTLVASQIS